MKGRRKGSAAESNPDDEVVGTGVADSSGKSVGGAAAEARAGSESLADERIARAEELLVSGNPALAAEQFRAALQLDPGSVPAMIGLGGVYLTLAQYDAAEKEYRKALRLAPNTAELHHHLGLTLYRRGVYSGAAQQLRRAIELDREHAPSYLILGEALNQVGEIDAAIDALEDALRLQPESGRAFYALGIAYDRKGQPDRAAEMYRRSREVGGR
jgi:Tfp pilus assembly protein PilF